MTKEYICDGTNCNGDTPDYTCNDCDLDFCDSCCSIDPCENCNELDCETTGCTNMKIYKCPNCGSNNIFTI